MKNLLSDQSYRLGVAAAFFAEYNAQIGNTELTKEIWLQVINEPASVYRLYAECLKNSFSNYWIAAIQAELTVLLSKLNISNLQLNINTYKNGYEKCIKAIVKIKADKASKTCFSEMRRLAGLTQKDVESTGIFVQQILSVYETTDRMPNLARAIEYSNILDCTPLLLCYKAD